MAINVMCDPESNLRQKKINSSKGQYGKNWQNLNMGSGVDTISSMLLNGNSEIEALNLSVCQFPWTVYCHNGWFQATKTLTKSLKNS